MLIDNCRIEVETWPLRVPFRISRGAKTEAAVVTVSLKSGAFIGRGECCPYPRYGETVESIARTLSKFDLNDLGHSNFSALRAGLQDALAPGSARNALDCALWDLEAKISGIPVSKLAGLPAPMPVTTCFTLSLDTPVAMADAAGRHADCPLLKLKLGDAGRDIDRMKLVRAARPDARLVADANEGWLPSDLSAMMEAAEAYGIEVTEQPLPAANDDALGAVELGNGSIFCADEAAAPGSDIRELVGRYQAVNVKLD